MGLYRGRVIEESSPASSDLGGATGPPDSSAAPKTRVRARHKGERTRRALLGAAEQVFGELGYHEASVAKITDVAGVAQGTFYLYFESKLAVFEEVVAELNRQVRHAMSEAAAGATSRLEAERLGFAGFFRFTAEHPALYRVIRQAEFVSPRAMRQHYESIIASYIPALREAMAEGEVAPGDPAVLAWALIAVGEAVGMRWILWDEASDVPPAVFDEMVRILARMLGVDSTTRDPAP